MSAMINYSRGDLALSLLKKAIAWGTRKSPWIIHFNAGSCNGCDIEIVDALTPRFDLERLGILQRGTPRHADVLVCTGAVTLQTKDRLKQIYDQMPEPKFVIATGTCACSGGIQRLLLCHGGIDSVIPVDVYIPGCAPPGSDYQRRCRFWCPELSKREVARMQTEEAIIHKLAEKFSILKDKLYVQRSNAFFEFLTGRNLNRSCPTCAIKWDSTGPAMLWGRMKVKILVSFIC